ncbi:NACHT domain-containing protein [Fusarium sp. Ph1]|nr:NACHT domain-containing protein [Fusarium sp. Ph1]
MSGMEPLAALGLACNIMQLLSFGGEAISLCRKVYKTGEIDPSLKDYSSQTAKICENLNDTLTQRQLNLGPDALALQQRATMCKAAADRLNHELELLTPAAGPGGWRRGFIAPIKAIRHKHHLSELEKDLNSLKSGLDTQLLVRIFDLVDPAKLKTEILVESKGLLATTLQQVASRQQDLSQQIVKALEGAQDRFNSEYLRNQRTIEQQIAATTRYLHDERTRVQQEKRDNEQRRDWDQLLKSLHVDARTERVNMIKQEYSDTCRWIFRPSTEYGLASDDNPQQAYPESHPRSWPCFTTWLQSERPSIYWICGKPGSGKSTLMKFIASDESPTRDSLKQWQSGVQILSHYFWLAGSPMQNNIKGFLCSLVYQVLSQDPSLALTLLETKPAIARKSSAMDWDQTELRRILINLAHQPVKAFCIFIDGLDELSSEESPRDLIDIIKEVQSPQVKVCLSSRPEPAMKMYLGHYPTLPMHVFIRDDIRNYAEGILNRAMSHRNGAFEIDRLVDNILSEADGVFLWVVLVTRSLERGIEKGDSLQILEERLRQMPKSLSELYSSMWQRREDDPETYQKGFSEFMNLMILAEDMLYLTHHKKVTVFELMAATNTSFLDKYLNQDDQVSGEELELLCRGTRNSIEAWSAGLLMVTNTPDTDSDADSEDMSLRMTENDGDSGTYYDLDDLEFYANMTVGFVHRTARDFLLDEVEGQKLWKRVDVSREDLEAKLMKAVLMRCQLWEFEDSVGFIDDFFDSMQPYEEAAYVPQSTLPDIEKAFYNGFVWRFGGKHLDRHQLRIDFLEAAADYGFRGYVFKQIQEMQQTGQLKAQDYASLLYAYCSRRQIISRFDRNIAARERLIQSLLSSGPSVAKIPFSPDFNLSRSLLLTYLLSILQAYPYRWMMEEAVTTLALLWKQAPSIQNVYVHLVVGFLNPLGDDHTSVRWRIHNSRSIHGEVDPLVVMRVNVPYLVMAIGSLVHPSLCIPGTPSKKEEPSAQAILISISEEIWDVQDYYPIESEEDSRKITECITPLVHCKHGSDLQKTRKIERTEWRKLGQILRQIASEVKPLNIKVDRECDEETRSQRVDAAIDDFLSDKVTRVSPPWWRVKGLEKTGQSSWDNSQFL